MSRNLNLEAHLPHLPFLQSLLENTTDGLRFVVPELDRSLNRKFPTLDLEAFNGLLRARPDVTSYFQQADPHDNYRETQQHMYLLIGYELGLYGLVVPVRNRLLDRIPNSSINLRLRKRVMDGILISGVYLRKSPEGNIDHQALFDRAFPPPVRRKRPANMLQLPLRQTTAL